MVGNVTVMGIKAYNLKYYFWQSWTYWLLCQHSTCHIPIVGTVLRSASYFIKFSPFLCSGSIHEHSTPPGVTVLNDALFWFCSFFFKSLNYKNRNTQLQHFQPPDISKWTYHWTLNNKIQTNKLKWPPTAFFFFKYIRTNSINLSNNWAGIYWRETQKQVLSPQLTLALPWARYLLQTHPLTHDSLSLRSI